VPKTRYSSKMQTKLNTYRETAGNKIERVDDALESFYEVRQQRQNSVERLQSSIITDRFSQERPLDVEQIAKH